MWLFSWLFRCGHGSYSWPRTTKRKTYVVCTDCGSELMYDWNQMKIVSPREQRARLRLSETA